MPGYFFIKFESFGRGTYEEPVKETVSQIDIRENDLNNDDKQTLKNIFSQDTTIIIQCDNENVSMPFNYKQENSNSSNLKIVFPDEISQNADKQFVRTYNQSGHSLTFKTIEPANEFKISITDKEYKELINVLNTTYIISGQKKIIIGVKTTDEIKFTREKSVFTLAELDIDSKSKLITYSKTAVNLVKRKVFGFGGKTKKRRYRKSKKIYKGKRKSHKYHKQK